MFGVRGIAVVAGADVRRIVRVFDSPDHLRFEDELRALRHPDQRGP